ncbi:SixA phosphatase family protein [Mycobacterium leprae]|nr:histidine phosphatase family protein [Mycobacterium leprae]
MKDEYRCLVLMRHAKSSYPRGFPDHIADHDRRLAPRGVREASLAGGWLRTNVPAIEKVLCSTAMRARETLTHSGIEAPVRYTERLYRADPDTVIKEIKAISDEVTTSLIVSHEPTISAVALALTGSGTNNDAAQRISTKFPTSGIAVLNVAGRWQHLELESAELVAFHVPR